MNDIDNILNQLNLEELTGTQTSETFSDVSDTLETSQESSVGNSDTSITEDIFEEVLHDNSLESSVTEEHFTSDAIEEVPMESESTEDEEQLPENSPTYNTNEYTARFSGTQWYTEISKYPVILAGLGGIGSHLAFQLSRLGILSLTTYDDDIIEPVNMAGQLYRLQDVGRFKSQATTTVIKEFGNAYTRIYSNNTQFTERSNSGPIMMCGFDNMEARKTFYNSWKKGVARYRENVDKKTCLFLDGRLSIDTLQVLCITGDNEYAMKRYEEKFLFDSSEADETICSMKQTTYMASMIGAVMANLFVNFVANLTDPIIPYNLPFFTEYDAQNMLFKVEN